MPCNEPRLKEIEDRIKQINEGSEEAYAGEKTDLIEEQKRLYKYEQDFPHVFLPPEDAKGEHVIRYFRTDDEKRAFVSAYVSLRAVKQARQVLEKTWKPTKKQRSLADDAGESEPSGENGRE